MTAVVTKVCFVLRKTDADGAICALILPKVTEMMGLPKELSALYLSVCFSDDSRADDVAINPFQKLTISLIGTLAL